MNNLARYEFESLIEEPVDPSAQFAELEPPPRLVTEAELTTLLANAEAAGHAEGRLEAMQSNEARAGEILCKLATTLARQHDQIKKITDTITDDAVALSRMIAYKIAGDAIQNDPTSLVEPLIAKTLGQLTGPLRLQINVNDSLVDEIRKKTQTLVEHIGLQAGIVVSGGGQHMTDCAIEWANGGVSRDLEALLAEIDRHIGVHGYAPTLAAGEDDLAISESPDPAAQPGQDDTEPQPTTPNETGE